MAIIDVSHEKFKAPTHTNWMWMRMGIRVPAIELQPQVRRNGTGQVQKARPKWSQSSPETACVSDCGIFQIYIGVIKPRSTMRDTHTKKCPKNQTKFGSKKQLRYLFVFSKPGTYHPPRRLKGGGAPLDNIWGCPANILHRNILRQWASILYT